MRRGGSRGGRRADGRARRSLFSPFGVTIAWTVRRRHIMPARNRPPMRHPRLLLAATALAALACGPLSAADPARPGPPRFSVGYIDRRADPRSDFAPLAFGAGHEWNPL